MQPENYDVSIRRELAIESSKQGRRNVTESEGASESSISSRVKTNLSTINFYADLYFPRPGESFSV